jgi:hypothetical protein
MIENIIVIYFMTGEKMAQSWSWDELAVTTCMSGFELARIDR